MVVSILAESTWQIFGGKLGRSFEDKLHVAIYLRQKKQDNFGAQQTNNAMMLTTMMVHHTNNK